METPNYPKWIKAKSKQKPLSSKGFVPTGMDEREGFEFVQMKYVKEAVSRLKEFITNLDRYDKNKIKDKIKEIFGEFE